MFWWKSLHQVDLEIKENLFDYNFGNALVVDLEFNEWSDYNFGNALVVDLEFNEWSDYNFGNALVVKTSLVEMEGLDFLRIVDLW